MFLAGIAEHHGQTHLGASYLQLCKHPTLANVGDNAALLHLVGLQHGYRAAEPGVKPLQPTSHFQPFANS
jgi:hypothetical protein